MIVIRVLSNQKYSNHYYTTTTSTYTHMPYVMLRGIIIHVISSPLSPKAVRRLGRLCRGTVSCSVTGGVCLVLLCSTLVDFAC